MNHKYISKLKTSTLHLSKSVMIIEHNLEDFGLDINAAFINWLARENPNRRFPERFCKYVISKDPFNLICKSVSK